MLDRITRDVGSDALCHQIRVHTQERVAVGWDDLVDDPAEVDALAVGVIGGEHADALGLVEVIWRERDRDGAITVIGLARAVGVHTQADFGINRADDDADICRWLPGQDKEVLVTVRLVGQGVGEVAFGDNRLAFTVKPVCRVSAGRIRIVRSDQDSGSIVVNHFDNHARDGQTIKGIAVARGHALDHGVLDHNVARAFGQQIVWRADKDCLWDKEVRPVEEERDALFESVQADRGPTGARIGFILRHRRCSHTHGVFRRAGQDDVVAVGDQRAIGERILEHTQRAVILDDEDPGLVVIADLSRDILDEGLCVALDQVVEGDLVRDQARVAGQRVGHDRDRVALGHTFQIRATNIERVGAQTADDFDDDVFRSRLDEERVIAFGRVDSDLLDGVVGDEQTATEHTVFRDYEVVAELGADDRDGVEAVAAVDPDWCVNVERHEVGALTTIDVGEWCPWIVGVNVDEGADGERVVVVLTEEEDLCIVREDSERVIAVATEQGRGDRDTVRQEPARRLRRLEEVIRQQAVERVVLVPSGGEDLTDLEDIVASVTEQHQSRQVVVQHECIVSVAAEDLNGAVDAVVVLDPLHEAGVCGQAGDRVDLDRRHNTHTAVSICTEQEEVIFHGAEDPQGIDTRIAWGQIRDPDDRRTQTRQTHVIGVRTGLTCNIQRAANAVQEGLARTLIIVDADNVVTGAEAQNHKAVDLFDRDDVVGFAADRVLVAGDDFGQALNGAVDVETVVAIGQQQGDALDAEILDTTRGAQTRDRCGGQHPAAIR